MGHSVGHRAEPRPASHVTPRRVRNATLGLGLFLPGVAILLGLVYIANDSSEFSEHLIISMGLAVTSLVSALGQILAILGLVHLWKARKAGSDR